MENINKDLLFLNSTDMFSLMVNNFYHNINIRPDQLEKFLKNLISDTDHIPSIYGYFPGDIWYDNTFILNINFNNTDYLEIFLLEYISFYNIIDLFKNPDNFRLVEVRFHYRLTSIISNEKVVPLNIFKNISKDIIPKLTEIINLYDKEDNNNG